MQRSFCSTSLLRLTPNLLANFRQISKRKAGDKPSDVQMHSTVQPASADVPQLQSQSPIIHKSRQTNYANDVFTFSFEKPRRIVKSGGSFLNRAVLGLIAVPMVEEPSTNSGYPVYWLIKKALNVSCLPRLACPLPLRILYNIFCQPRITLLAQRAERYSTSNAKCDPPGDPSGPYMVNTQGWEKHTRIKKQLQVRMLNKKICRPKWETLQNPLCKTK